MTEKGDSPHQMVNPPSLPPPIGYSHGVVAAPGRTVYLAGQAGHGPDGSLPEGGVVPHFDAACGNIARALEAAGGEPGHLVSIEIFVTDAAEYRANLGPIGAAWRKHFGRYFPAMGLFEVKGLFDPRATVELMAVAVIPPD
jgi:enamine deaminase RidA (YjgF/YER057c/UK114 family)